MPEFDPRTHEQPVRALVQVLRALPLGGIVTLPSGATVKSVPMNHGPSQIRRYVVAKEKNGLPRKLTRSNTAATADEAARQVLRKKGGSNAS